MTTEDSLRYPLPPWQKVVWVFHYVLAMIPLLQSKCLCYGRNNAEINWLGLKLIHIAAKLTFSWGCISKRNMFFLCQFFWQWTVCRNTVRWTERVWQLYIYTNNQACSFSWLASQVLISASLLGVLLLVFSFIAVIAILSSFITKTYSYHLIPLFINISSEVLNF